MTTDSPAPTCLDEAQIQWENASGADVCGRVFRLDGRVLRQIPPNRVGGFRRLIAAPEVQELIRRRLLVETWETDLHVVPGDLVVEHRRVNVVSYPSEWGSAMLRDAGLLVVDMQLALLDQGMVITDVHPWNVLFDDHGPVFIDLGALVFVDELDRWSPSARPWADTMVQFRQFYLNPLRLMAAGEHAAARAVTRDYIGASELLGRTGSDRVMDALGDAARRAVKKLRPRLRRAGRVIPPPVRSRIRRRRANRGPIDPSQVTHDFVQPKNYRGELQAIRAQLAELGVVGASFWTGYYEALHGDEFPDEQASSQRGQKQAVVSRVLSQLQPSTVLDIGSNTGLYSRLASSLGASVIAADVDEQCVNRIYEVSRERGDRILPLVMDVRSPTPPCGPLLCWTTSPFTRLRSEMVFALAVTHHLVFSLQMTFPQIAGTLAAFSSRHALVEFVPPQDEWVREIVQPIHSWYTEERFVEALNEHFEIVERVDSAPAPRVLFLCARR